MKMMEKSIFSETEVSPFSAYAKWEEAVFTGIADVLVRNERSESIVRDCVAFADEDVPRSQ